jgi:hypothetical protein
MKLLTVQLRPFCRYFISLRSKYTEPCPVKAFGWKLGPVRVNYWDGMSYENGCSVMDIRFGAWATVGSSSYRPLCEVLATPCWKHRRFHFWIPFRVVYSLLTRVKIPVVGWLLWCCAGGTCTTICTIRLIFVGSMTRQILSTDWKHQAVTGSV